MTDSQLSGPGSMIRESRRFQNAAIAVAVGVFAFALYLWQLSVPEVLSAYDSGVYFAASFHFAAGALPYRDFVFVNPPGILLLMSPVALISRVIGSHDGFIIARVVTSLVTALNAALLAWLLRCRGRVAMIMAGAGLAVLPVAFFVSSAVKLDPYCICLVLLGSAAIYPRSDESGPRSTKRLAVAGFLFGLAALVKLWAFFPFLALVICLAPRCRRRVLIVVAGAAAGFIVPSMPFILSAPRSFISQVFTVPLFGTGSSTTNQGILLRLISITGFNNTSIAPAPTEIVFVVCVLLFVIAIAYWRHVVIDNVETYLLIASVTTVCGLLIAPNYSQYYGYFGAVFLVGAVAASVSRVGEAFRRFLRHLPVSQSVQRSVSWLSSLTGVVLLFALTLYVTTFYTNFAWWNGTYGPFLSPIDAIVPSGSCVVYNFVYFGVYANRLQASNSSCPSVSDPFGLWQVWGSRFNNPPKAFVAEWKSYFESAQFVVFNSPHTSDIPWDRNLTSWFAVHYHLLYGRDSLFIYSNCSNT